MTLSNLNWYSDVYPDISRTRVSVTDEPLYLLGWQRDLSGGNVAHTFRITETAREPEDVEALKLRIACHYLLDIVSNEGLPELIESIKEILEFYEGRESVPSTHAKISTVKCGVGQKYERPVFHVERE